MEHEPHQLHPAKIGSAGSFLALLQDFKMLYGPVKAGMFLQSAFAASALVRRGFDLQGQGEIRYSSLTRDNSARVLAVFHVSLPDPKPPRG